MQGLYHNKRIQKILCLFFITTLLAACGGRKRRGFHSNLPTDTPPPTAAQTDLVPQTKVEPLSAASTALNTSQPAPSADYTYAIQPGDTLMKIAFTVYGDIYRWKEIFQINQDQIQDPNRINKKITLKLTQAPQNKSSSSEDHQEKYLIKQGDTLGKIAQQLFGTPKKWRALWDQNKELIRNPHKIFSGFFLYYTPEDHPAPPAASSTTSQNSATPPETPQTTAVTPPKSTTPQPQPLIQIPDSWKTTTP